MNFNAIFNETWKLLGDHVKNIAQRSSLCPEIPMRLWVKGEYLRNAREALAVLAVLPLALPGTRNYFLMSDLREHIAKMAENYNLEGDWKIVGEILQSQTSLEVYGTWNILLSKMSTQDWFGNFSKELVRATRALKYQKSQPSVSEDTRPYQKPQRKRGYDDKGSRADPSRWLPRVPRSSTKKAKIHIKLPRPFAWFSLFIC